MPTIRNAGFSRGPQPLRSSRADRGRLRGQGATTGSGDGTGSRRPARRGPGDQARAGQSTMLRTHGRAERPPQLDVRVEFPNEPRLLHGETHPHWATPSDIGKRRGARAPHLPRIAIATLRIRSAGFGRCRTLRSSRTDRRHLRGLCCISPHSATTKPAPALGTSPRTGSANPVGRFLTLGIGRVVRRFAPPGVPSREALEARSRFELRPIHGEVLIGKQTTRPRDEVSATTGSEDAADRHRVDGQETTGARPCALAAQPSHLALNLKCASSSHEPRLLFGETYPRWGHDVMSAGPLASGEARGRPAYPAS